jgi:hypothetical protein
MVEEVGIFLCKAVTLLITKRLKLSEKVVLGLTQYLDKLHGKL